MPVSVVCHALTRLMKCLPTSPPDGVILSTPTKMHVSQGLVCIRHGCPVIIEKPLGVTARESARLVSAAEDAGVGLLVGHHRRHNPLIRKAHEVIAAGEIGGVAGSAREHLVLQARQLF